VCRVGRGLHGGCRVGFRGVPQDTEDVPVVVGLHDRDLRTASRTLVTTDRRGQLELDGLLAVELGHEGLALG
jgi:hypothetical protein